MRQIFDEVQKNFKMWVVYMPLRSTFGIGTQIILLKIDGFLQRLDLKYHPSQGSWDSWATDQIGA